MAVNEPLSAPTRQDATIGDPGPRLQEIIVELLARGVSGDGDRPGVCVRGAPAARPAASHELEERRDLGCGIGRGRVNLGAAALPGENDEPGALQYGNVPRDCRLGDVERVGERTDMTRRGERQPHDLEPVRIAQGFEGVVHARSLPARTDTGKRTPDAGTARATPL